MRPLRLILFWKALLLCLIAFVGSPTFAGLLVEPGFERTSSSSLWELSPGARVPSGGSASYPAAYEGSFLLKLEANGGLVGSMSFAKQSLPASGQQEWTFSGHMLNYDTVGVMMKSGSYGLLEIVFTGAAFGEQRFSSDHYMPEAKGNATPANWSSGSVTAVAPAGSEQVTFYVKIVQGEPPEGGQLEGGYGSIWWDAMNATVVDPVPELASTGWVAVLIVGMAIGGQQLRNRRAARAKMPVSL